MRERKALVASCSCVVSWSWVMYPLEGVEAPSTRPATVEVLVASPANEMCFGCPGEAPAVRKRCVVGRAEMVESVARTGGALAPVWKTLTDCVGGTVAFLTGDKMSLLARATQSPNADALWERK